MTEKKLDKKCRLLIVSSSGMGDSWEQQKASWKGWVISLFFQMRKVREDLNGAEQALKESPLENFLIVRPGILNDQPPRGVEKLQEANNTEPLLDYDISRADVAAFMVRETVEPKYTSKEAITLVWAK